MTCNDFTASGGLRRKGTAVAPDRNHYVAVGAVAHAATPEEK